MTTHEIVMIGAGNVSYHLARQFRKAGHKIVQVYSRSEAPAEILAAETEAEFTGDSNEIYKNGSLYVIAVHDDAINEIAERFSFPNAIVVHTSAITPKEILEPVSERFGVFYPLQSMTKGHPLDFSNVPVFIEASDDEVRKELFQIASQITGNVLYADLKKRMALHAAAVFVNNFGNHLFHIADVLLKKEKMDLDVLKPLMHETVKRLENRAPLDVQTGPARRGDMKTIEKHLEFLKEYPDFSEIYLVITESLINTYRK